MVAALHANPLLPTHMHSPFSPGSCIPWGCESSETAAWTALVPLFMGPPTSIAREDGN